MILVYKYKLVYHIVRYPSAAWSYCTSEEDQEHSPALTSPVSDTTTETKDASRIESHL